MTHDPLCPNFHLEDDCTCEPRNGEHDMKCACWDCECDIIAKVRADERQACIEIVQSVGADDQNNAGRNVWRNEALVKLGYSGHI